MTLLQYHCLWSIVKGPEPNPEATSIISSSTPTQDAIDSWRDKDGNAQAFMFFNMKLQVLGKDSKIAEELWDAVQ